MIKKNFTIIERILLSGFFTGYIPFASGTFGSLAALLLYFIPGFERPVVMIGAILISLIYGLLYAGKFEAVYGEDPSECTLDEMTGMWISLLFLPKSVLIAGVSFLIWRALDIIKPYPARQAEKLQAGFGIMLDDVISALYTLFIMHILVYLGL